MISHRKSGRRLGGRRCPGRLAGFVLVGGMGLAGMAGWGAGVPDVPFSQEWHEPHPVQPGGPGDDVRAVAVTPDGRVWAATQGGFLRLSNPGWTRPEGGPDGPAYDLLVTKDGRLWGGGWDGVYLCKPDGRWSKPAGPDGPITVLVETDAGLLALGPDGCWRRGKGAWQEIGCRTARSIRGAAFAPGQGLWIATGLGLYHGLGETGAPAPRLFCRANELVSSELRAVAFGPDGRLWTGGLGGLDVYRDGRRTAHFTGAEGLPCYDVRSLTFGPDGRLWVGTGLGVARFDGRRWSLRHSHRWLLSDDVRDVAIGPDGTAWVATGKGVSAIRQRSLTLAEKAAHYLRICHQRHIRPPGLVEKCYLPDPADPTRFEPRDDDNDGQYTAMYLAMESFRYAVTRDPEARRRADAAYDALEFLQTVTGARSFVARTVVPADWTRMADANEEVSPPAAVERRVRDPREKIVPRRWRPSADGKWLWKGDTSSDEITGHFYGYLIYHDLAATPERRRRVRRHVRRILDGIIADGYVLRDLDGRATRWGVWSPAQLNHDPDWRVERPINSFEILSYLRTAYHLTADEKYLREYRRLLREEHYGRNARRPKDFGRAERSHIDDELLALAAPGLLQFEDDPAWRRIFREGYTWAWRTVARENSPFYNFTYGWLTGGEFPLAESVAFLRDTPLDLRQWTVDNSRRDDLRLVRRPWLEPLQTHRLPPADERGIMRWDKNPWEAASGDFHDPEGRLESCGVFWLLPYWMARYAGFIDPPDSEPEGSATD